MAGMRKSTSGYSGVILEKERELKYGSESFKNMVVSKFNKYRAYIELRDGFNQCIYVGWYDTPREAALARDKKILSLGIDEPLQILKPKI